MDDSKRKSRTSGNCRYLRKVINCYMLLIIDYIFSSSSISSFKSFSNSSSTSSSIDSDIPPKKCAHLMHIYFSYQVVAFLVLTGL